MDDEPIVLDAFERAFAGQDEFVLDTARTVREALEKLAQTQYSLIFMDMDLEGHSWAGMQLIREINRLEIRGRARGQPVIEARVIIMSGHVPFSDFMHEAQELGILTYLNKPVDFTPEFIRSKLKRIGLPILPERSPNEPLTAKPNDDTMPA